MVYHPPIVLWYHVIATSSNTAYYQHLPTSTNIYQHLPTSTNIHQHCLAVWGCFGAWYRHQYPIKLSQVTTSRSSRTRPSRDDPTSIASWSRDAARPWKRTSGSGGGSFGVWDGCGMDVGWMWDDGMMVWWDVALDLVWFIVLTY